MQGVWGTKLGFDAQLSDFVLPYGGLHAECSVFLVPML